ncbi:MAG TPA: DEAD/DEAH box helicase [Vicinamibacterales bacterium]|jgi:DEAD/DEAH box helicase domain-containing protein|nr:DEAD/DEAH box helicase [Vicinamibacterales bacterium]
MDAGALVAGPAKDQALSGVLDRLTGGVTERPDRPDAWVTAVRRLPALDARHAPFVDGIDERVREVLRQRGIDQLYTHQAAAISHSLAGRHVVITTPTASGKTLCYNAPVLSTVLRDPSTRALYLFPTKALAQDQLAELHQLSDQLSRRNDLQIGVFTYDGDTPQDARRAIRGRAHVVLSNADMLHSGILPHHPRWAKLFENLRFIVIDELHAYRGVFGSHLTNVLRRLRRICQHYGSTPTFICSSATIANPRELAEALVEQPFELVSESGAPRGEKFFLFVNPPVVNEQLGIRRSYLAETRRVAAEFVKRKLQTIVFAQSRLATEILTTYLKDDFGSPPGSTEEIRGYRGGYLPQRRREIERGLREGTVRAVVSTNALELGIDIGALDACVMAGYPGSIAATWQRAGRAGRRSGRSAAVLVASSAPLDQFVVRTPSYFFDASPEHALVNPDNLHILVDHVKCAAFELPFTTSEQYALRLGLSEGLAQGASAPAVDVQEVLGILQEGGFVHRAAGEDGEGVWQWTNESYPADAVSLRSISSDNFVVVDTTNGADVIGETSFTSGPPTLHEKAIYLLEGGLYQVERLDFDGRKAYVRQIDCDYYTDAITYTKVTVLETFETGNQPAADQSRPGLPGPASHGEVHVSSRVVGFKKIKFYTNENVGSGELDLPEQEMHTTAYWLTVPRDVIAALPYAADDRRDGVVGLSYAMRQVAQLLLMCDRQDIGISIGSGEHGEQTDLTRSGDPAMLSDEPRIFVYDNYPGGIGFSAPLFAMDRELRDRTRELIAGCECQHGCPGCVGPIGNTGPLAKTAALRILELIGARQIESADTRVASL